MIFSRQKTQSAAAYGQTTAAEYDEGLRSYLLTIYNYMASALVLTGIVAMITAQTPALMSLFYVMSPSGQMLGMKPLGWLVVFAPLGFSLFLGMRIHAMSFQTAQTTFWAFAVVMGLSLSSIFLVYTGASIARVFFITAGTFGAMSLYGYTTKRDLTGFGSFLIMGLIGIILASVVNMFLRSSGLHFAVSVLGVLIFTGLIAYDTQRLKAMYYEMGSYGDMAKKLAIMGALSLYLDFINLFIHLLRFFGDRR